MIQRGSDRGEGVFVLDCHLIFSLTDKNSEEISLVLVATFLQMELRTLSVFETILLKNIIQRCFSSEQVTSNLVMQDKFAFVNKTFLDGFYR